MFVSPLTCLSQAVLAGYSGMHPAVGGRGDVATEDQRGTDGPAALLEHVLGQPAEMLSGARKMPGRSLMVAGRGNKRPVPGILNI